MGYIISISLLYCFAVFLPNISCLSLIRPFWRKTIVNPPTQPPTLLPPEAKNPEFYKKLQIVPPKNETAKKLIKNILRIRPGVKGKRDITYEDTVVVMDGSGSIGKCEFEKGKKAIKNLVGYVQSGLSARYGMVTFASTARKDFDFQPPSVAASLVDGVSFPGGGTNTHDGLKKASDLFIAGGRGLSDKFVILLTDGQSHDRDKALLSAQKLKDKGVKIFVIAVGGSTMHGINEMAHVASNPPKENLFRVKTVQDFLKVVILAIKEVDSTYVLDGEYDPPC